MISPYPNLCVYSIFSHSWMFWPEYYSICYHLKHLSLVNFLSFFSVSINYGKVRRFETNPTLAQYTRTSGEYYAFIGLVPNKNTWKKQMNFVRIWFLLLHYHSLEQVAWNGPWPLYARKSFCNAEHFVK